MILELLIIIPVTASFIVAVYNLFNTPELKGSLVSQDNLPKVSILIPARNEEKNIRKCLTDVFNQDYKNKEVILLDDNSADGTKKIASEFLKNNPLKIIDGKELPEGWIGKNWACHQLAQNSLGSYMLFLDADVELHSTAVSSAVSEVIKNDLVLVSVFSTQRIKTFGERLIVPLMNWLLLAFLPLIFVFTSSNKSFVAANGQFMLWRRREYFTIGGHKFVFNKPVEDMELAREVKKRNLRMKTLLGGKKIYCRMYYSFNDAIKGFSKNFYPGFNINAALFLSFILFLTIVFTLPVLFFMESPLLIISSVLIVLNRSIVSYISKQSVIWNVLLHPFQMLLMLAVGVISVYKSKSKRLEWKGRKF